MDAEVVKNKLVQLCVECIVEIEQHPEDEMYILGIRTGIEKASEAMGFDPLEVYDEAEKQIKSVKSLAYFSKGIV